MPRKSLVIVMHGHKLPKVAPTTPPAPVLPRDAGKSRTELLKHINELELLVETLRHELQIERRYADRLHDRAVNREYGRTALVLRDFDVEQT